LQHTRTHMHRLAHTHSLICLHSVHLCYLRLHGHSDRLVFKTKYLLRESVGAVGCFAIIKVFPFLSLS
jgi:hypothetical protein